MGPGLPRRDRRSASLSGEYASTIIETHGRLQEEVIDEQDPLRHIFLDHMGQTHDVLVL